jgi:hypothetical protein
VYLHQTKKVPLRLFRLYHYVSETKSSEGNQFCSETENPISNNEINDKEDINIEKQQKYNENNIQYPPYEEEAGIIDSQIRNEKV